ncbi:MAG: phosphatase PAP2 family protein [Chloroflexi bacterium]|nr:phosphatase PAP2 family protein [Chloroflexota bacterium]
MSRPAPATALVVAIGLATVVLLAVLVVTGIARPVDRAAIETVRSPALLEPLAPLRAVTELGSTWAVAIVALLMVPIGFLIGPWLHGLLGAGVVALASIGNSLAKTFVARERPDLLEPIVTEPGYSFPSGHSLLGMAAWGVLAVLVARSRLPRAARLTLIAGLGALIFLIGLSRVYLGVHYPTDVVAGWTAGAVIVFVYARLTREVPKAPAVEVAAADPEAPRSDPPAAD